MSEIVEKNTEFSPVRLKKKGSEIIQILLK